jgi:hypothetical protein
MRICRHDELPVYERLGDERSRAITQGKVGLQLAAWGDSRQRWLRSFEHARA